jgi:o-succinylbenzoate---CoA ligase
MRSIPKSLTINGKYYTSEELLLHANELRAPGKPGWENSLGEFLQQWLNDEETIAVMTSGSTGAPKLTRLSKKAMLTSASMTGSYLCFREGQTALLCLNSAYIAGMMMVVRAMTYRMNLITVPPDGSPLSHISGKTPVDFAALVPAQVFNSLNQTDTLQKLQFIGTLIIGGAQLSPELENRIEGFDGKIYATFGMTETITHIALRRINGPERTDVYTVLPGILIETDNRGCLVVTVPYIESGKIVTNDLISIESNVTFRWLGRADNIINSGGIKIIPETTEKKIARYIQGRFFIASLPDPKFGELPVLVIEAPEKLSDNQKTELAERIKPLVNKEEMPRQILQSLNFSETATGKVNRKESLKSATE